MLRIAASCDVSSGGRSAVVDFTSEKFLDSEEGPSDAS